MEEKRFEEEDFGEFLQELINNNRFSDPKEVGIAKSAIDKGFEELSGKQKFVLKKAISHYTYEECIRCRLDIPWVEMIGAEDNGGMCGWCQQLSRNDKD